MSETPMFNPSRFENRDAAVDYYYGRVLKLEQKIDVLQLEISHLKAQLARRAAA